MNSGFPAGFFESAFVNRVCADIDRDDGIAVQVKGGPEVVLDIYGIDCAAVNDGKILDFMRAQAWIKGIVPKIFHARRAASFCELLSR